MEYSAPFYRREVLRFKCTGCGACCSTRNDHYVYLSGEEIERIRDYLGLTLAWFKRRYLQKIAGEGWVLALTDDENCLFLGSDRRCEIYSVRPGQCSSYPYWPELVLRKRDWQREAKRCEGIGRGSVVSTTKIDRMLELQRSDSGEK